MVGFAVFPLFPEYLFFGLVPIFFILCNGSSFICRSFVAINASGIVFFSYVFCLISSVIFLSSNVFYFIILSCSFFSVIDVIYFDISNSSAEIVLKLHSFSSSISLLKIFPVFPLPSVLPKSNLLGYGKCFVLICKSR